MIELQTVSHQILWFFLSSREAGGARTQCGTKQNWPVSNVDLTVNYSGTASSWRQFPLHHTTYFLVSQPCIASAASFLIKSEAVFLREGLFLIKLRRDAARGGCMPGFGGLLCRHAGLITSRSLQEEPEPEVSVPRVPSTVVCLRTASRFLLKPAPPSLRRATTQRGWLMLRFAA